MRLISTQGTSRRRVSWSAWVLSVGSCRHCFLKQLVRDNQKCYAKVLPIQQLHQCEMRIRSQVWSNWAECRRNPANVVESTGEIQKKILQESNEKIRLNEPKIYARRICSRTSENELRFWGRVAGCGIGAPARRISDRACCFIFFSTRIFASNKISTNFMILICSTRSFQKHVFVVIVAPMVAVRHKFIDFFGSTIFCSTITFFADSTMLKILFSSVIFRTFILQVI